MKKVFGGVISEDRIRVVFILGIIGFSLGFGLEKFRVGSVYENKIFVFFYFLAFLK